MLHVKGFRGLRFNPAKAGNLDQIITPPYDVITPEERAKLAGQSAHNMVHLILPAEKPGQTRYEAAACDLDTWIEAGSVVQDETPSLYLIRQQFTDLHGQPQTRRGFFAAVKLPEANEQYVLGHERTFSKPIEDRLKLTAATRANLGAIFVLYADQEKTLAPLYAPIDARPCDYSATTMDGVTQEFWRIDGDDAVPAFFEGKTLYIADGHHRFQTACTYRDAQRAAAQDKGTQPYDYVLMGFVDVDDAGLEIYPTHRIVAKPADFGAKAFLDKLRIYFDVTEAGGDLPARVADSEAACALGAAIPGAGNYLLTLRDIDRTELLGEDRGPAWCDLDVAVLHRGILDRMLGLPEGTEFRYEKSAARAMERVQENDTDLAFILRSTRADQIRACAEAREPMPQKSTYFYPKLPSGGVIHRLI